MKGYVPSKLEMNLERSADGQSTLIFREWHERIPTDEFQKVSQQTKNLACAMLKKCEDHGLDVQFSENKAEKSYEVIYTGKNIQPAIFAIYSELMPMLVTDEKEAFKTINALIAMINFYLQLEVTQP